MPFFRTASSSIFIPTQMSPDSSTIGTFSKFLGLDQVFRTKVIRLLDLGYSLRIRLPLFVSAAFVLCHFISNYVPRVEINVQVIEDEEDDEVDEEEDGNDEENDVRT